MVKSRSVISPSSARLISLCSFNTSPLYHLRAWHRLISLELLYLTITPEFVSLHVKNDILNRALKPSSSHFFFLFAHYRLKTPRNGSKLLISRVN